MKEYKILPRSKIFALFNILNKENISDCRAVAIREINISSLERVRLQILESHGVKPGYTSFVAKAVAQTLQEMPMANRAVIQTFFYTRVYSFLKTHVSVAVERNDSAEHVGGAFIYTIYNTDQKSHSEITQEIGGLSQQPLESQDPRLERWQRMKNGVKNVPFIWMIRLAIWMHKNIPALYIKNRGGAALISSPSKYGVDFIVAHWPYTLGVSFGLAKIRPWVEDGELVARQTMTMTLAFDRRIIPGADAARFMNRMCEILENAQSI